MSHSRKRMGRKHRKTQKAFGTKVGGWRPKGMKVGGWRPKSKSIKSSTVKSNK